MLPLVSIVVPLRNEEAHIERLARSLLDQDYPKDRYEILMADGGSTDATLEILKATDSERRIRVFANPARTAPAALNALIAASRGDVIVRVDGHSYVAPDYLRRIIEVMNETGESIVGGPVLMEADSSFRRALVEALYASFAVGSVPYRTRRERCYVPSLQTGAFRREVCERVGPFDESLAVVEDVDFNTRAARAGYRLLLDPSIRFWYIPRPSIGSLWRQIHGVGRIKVAVLAKHPDIIKMKYLIPAACVVMLLVAAVVLLAGLASRSPRLVLIGGSFPLMYALLVAGFALSRIRAIGVAAFWLLAIVPVLHVGYGTGFLLGLARLPRWRPAAARGVPASSARG
jgi:cellulose synthase/poly-beta-1,6-N-acetylglucosamine synthase-like glycosyltransferase